MKDRPYSIQDIEAQVASAPTNKHPDRPAIAITSSELWEPTMELRVFVKANKKHTIQQKWVSAGLWHEQFEWRDLPVIHQGEE